MADRLVHVERKGHVAEIALNRPSARNALSVALCNQLLSALQDIDEMVCDAGLRAVVLKGVGPSFCAGADLKERKGMAPDEMSRHSMLIASCADRLAELSCPVVACIHGAAVGGGMELALACDLRVCAKDAVLSFPEVKYGFFPGAGGPVRLVRLVGLSTARYLLMTAREIRGVEAKELHVAHVIADAEDVHTEAIALANEVAGLPPAGVRALRELLAGIDGAATTAAMGQARKLRDALNHSGEVAQALQGFGK